MQTIKTVIATLGCLGLIAVLAIYSGTRWVSNNQDKIAETVMQAAGPSEAMRKQCQMMETRYREEWDYAVNNHQMQRREGELGRLRKEIDSACRKN